MNGGGQGGGGFSGGYARGGMSGGGMGGGMGMGGYQPYGGMNTGMNTAYQNPWQSNKMGVQGYGGYNSSPPPQQPPMQDPVRAISDPPGAFGYGGQPQPPVMNGGMQSPTQPAPYQAQPMDPMSQMKMQGQNVGGFQAGRYTDPRNFAPVQQDSVGANRYMQNGQFNRGAAVNDYYGALDKLRGQGVSGQINLYDQFKQADGSYGGPFNNAMIADYAGGYQTPGAMGNWTGKRDGKNYWLGNQVDDMTFNERFKQGI